MANTITPVVTSTVTQAQAQLDPEQLQALFGSIKGAAILDLPNGAEIANLQSLNLSILPNGSARLNVAVKS